MRSSKQRLRGFSLVELLAVIGIVALLISVLLPLLAKARAEATKVKCMSNLRQLLHAQTMYVADSGGYLTFPNWSHDRATADVWPVGWLYAQGQTSNPPAADDVKTGALYPYLKNVQVYRCPVHAAAEAGPAEPGGSAGVDRLTSYIMNGAVCGYGAIGHRGADPVVWAPSRKITDWRNPSEQVLWWEAEEAGNGAAWNDGSSYPHENTLSRRHGRGACVGYFDGHAGWMDRLEFLAELQRPGPNRLYCDPARTDGGRP